MKACMTLSLYEEKVVYEKVFWVVLNCDNKSYGLTEKRQNALNIKTLEEAIEIGRFFCKYWFFLIILFIMKMMIVSKLIIFVSEMKKMSWQNNIVMV